MLSKIEGKRSYKKSKKELEDLLIEKFSCYGKKIGFLDILVLTIKAIDISISFLLLLL